MNKTGKLNSFLNGAGFYIVLLLALLTIGALGYYIFSTVMKPAPTLPSVQEQQETSLPVVESTVLSDPKPVESLPVSGTAQVAVDPPIEEPVSDKTVLPLKGEILTPYSMDALLYSETMEDWRTHDGIDIAAGGDSTVVSACSGTVTSIVDDYWLGTTVTISCADGCELLYGSLQSKTAVSVGQKLTAGDPIGQAGNTSILEEHCGNHLHFALRQDGAFRDPNLILSKAAK